MLSEHYVWRAIEQAKRIAGKIDERWPVESAAPRHNNVACQQG
jgi:hypothetical protein